MAQEQTNQPVESSSNTAMVFVAVMMVMIAILAFFFFGLPMLRQSVQQQVPAMPSIPDQIDVNVQMPEQNQ
jgi:hypothetical protein